MERGETALQRQRTLEHFANLGKTNTPQKAEVIHLPTWKEEQRGVPNVALRSALFAAVHEKDCTYVERQPLPGPKGFELRYTGKRLCQSDLDVWEMVLHLARMHPLGDRCEFTAHAFLKWLGRATGKWQHEWLKDVLARLQAAVAELTSRRGQTYSGRLIDYVGRNKETGLYVVVLNPSLAALYTVGWTAIDWDQRQQLKRKPLALWLHGFFATHAEPFPLKVETVRDMSGSQTQEKRYFKKNLIAALEELKAVGAITSYRFDSDLLHIERVPSPSQKRHLQRKIRTRR